MKEQTIEELENVNLNDENEHIINIWKPLEFNIDENYEYVPKGKFFEKCSNLLYYGIAIPILYIFMKVVYDLKIEGKENINSLEEGAISVSNHILVLDCAMVGLALEDKRVYYTTQEDSFKIPFVRKLIKLLRAIPIPTENKNKRYFMNAIDNIVKEGKIVHFYPEASLWPYYNKLRNFKTGAFRFAIRNNVPIIPMVFTFRRPVGIRRIFKRKSDVTLTILKPIKYKSKEENKKEIDNFKQEVYSVMNNVILEKRGRGNAK